MSLSRQEIERAKFAFSIYDFEGSNKIDANQLGNALRAMGLCPSLRRISNLGGTRTRNEKLLAVEEFLAIYQEAKQDKEQGTIEDYLECLSGYDKDRSGTISVSTLSGLLQGYGEEKLDKEETLEIIEDCGQPIQDQIDYEDFIMNLLKGPEIRIPPALLIQQARAGLGTDTNPETEGNSTKYSEIQNKRESIKDASKDATEGKTDIASSAEEKQIRRTRDSLKSNAETDAAGPEEEKQIKRARDSVKSNAETDAAGPEEEKQIKRTRDSIKSNAETDAAGPDEEKQIKRTRDSVKSNVETDAAGPDEEKQIKRTRDSVKSKAESVSEVNCETEKTEEKKTSRRESVKSGKKRGSSPDVSCASDHSVRKRGSVKSVDFNRDISPDGKSRGSRKSNKSAPSKKDSVKSEGTGERERSPDDITCASDISVAEEAKTMSRNRDSQKSVDDRGASPDISWASEEPSAKGADISKGRNSLKARETDSQSGKVSPDVSGASDRTDLTKSRGSLKSKSAGGGDSRSSAKSKSQKSEEQVKAKFQQPLISIKTQGLFGQKPAD